MANEKTIISVTEPTPKWATWTFRIVFLLTKVAIGIIAADPGIPDDLKVRIGLYLSGLDTLVWGLSRMVGVKIEEPQWGKK